MIWFYLIHIIEFIRLHVLKNVQESRDLAQRALEGQLRGISALVKTPRAIESPWYIEIMGGGFIFFCFTLFGEESHFD